MMNFKLKLPIWKAVGRRGRKVWNVKTDLKTLQVQNTWCPSRNGVGTSQREDEWGTSILQVTCSLTQIFPGLSRPDGPQSGISAYATERRKSG